MKAVLALSVLIEVVGLLSVIAIGMGALLHGGGVAMPSNALQTPRGGGVLIAILGGAVLASYALVGSENCVSLGEETKNPSKAFPRALFGGTLLAGILCVLVSLVAVMVVDPGALARSDGGLSVVVPETLILRWIFSVIVLVAVTNTALISFMMASLLLCGMARERIISPIFGRIHERRRTPIVAIGFVSVVAVPLTLTGMAPTLARTAVLLLSSVFVAMHVAVLKLRHHPVAHTHFRAPWMVPYLGTAMCLFLLAQQQPTTWVRAGLLVLVGVLLWLVNLLISRGQQGEADQLVKLAQLE
jgi:amino acid transporter